jgi:hypothetical protein
MITAARGIRVGLLEAEPAYRKETLSSSPQRAATAVGPPSSRPSPTRTSPHMTTCRNHAYHRWSSTYWMRVREVG